MSKYPILDKINSESDIKALSYDEINTLSAEIREFLVDKVSKTGGHIASNLGIVELTIALHRIFDMPQDKVILDVGHQSYVHKILTGRKEGFDTLREFGGMSGFPKREESEYDSFNTGHSSTSISAGLGIVKARDLSELHYSVISVIGDGAMTGGMAYEALNNASNCKTNFIIILNDNNMSIDKNVGGMSRYFDSIRTATPYLELKKNVENRLEKIPGGSHIVKGIKETKNSIKQLVIPGMLFENMGIKYLGPVDGHNVKHLETVLKDAKKINGPVLVHVITKKGAGYRPAELNPTKFHGIGPFDPKTGKTPLSNKESYTSVFSRALTVLGEDDKNIVAITAAMPDGTGLNVFKNAFPERFVDVGIAEEHGVTFAAGLATRGYTPVFTIYSSFLQRAFDQIIHDVCLQNLHVVFAIDRAGIVGKDGETHQGLFDISFLRMIPNMTVMAPKNKWELIDMLAFATSAHGPVAFRYGRGAASTNFSKYRHPIEYGKSEWLYHEEEIALLAYGSMVDVAAAVRDMIKEQGIGCSLVNIRFAKPLDEECMRTVAREHKLIVTLEEGILNGGVGSAIEEFYNKEETEVNLVKIGIDDEFVPHGAPDDLYKEYGLDATSIYTRVITKYLR